VTPKPFAWSISRLSAFELCPRRHNEVDLLKNFTEGPSPERDFGSDLHKALELACAKGQPLPPELRSYQDVVDKVRSLPGDKLFEQRMGITRQFEPCGYFADDIWLRVVSDVLILSEDGTRAAVIDYKSGKIKPDMSQLLLNAAVIFAYYPMVQTVDVAYWWVCKGRKLTKGMYHRVDLPEIWNKFLPRVKVYEKATQEGVFLANPSGICRKWCPVTSCQFHGGT
jgi:hypothetical protein